MFSGVIHYSPSSFSSLTTPPPTPPDFASPRVTYTLLCLPIAEIPSVGYTLKTSNTRTYALQSNKYVFWGYSSCSHAVCGRHLSGSASSPALLLCLGAVEGMLLPM